MGSLPSSRLTRILQEKADLLKKRRQSAESIVHEAESRIQNLGAIQITLPEAKDREAALRELMRRSDWEAVESGAKQFLEYIERTASGALETRRTAILDRGDRMRAAGSPLPPEGQALLEELRRPAEGQPWGETAGKLARLDAAIVEAENAFSAKIRTRASEMLDWAGEPADRRADLEQRFRGAMEPIHRGEVGAAVDGLNAAIREGLPTAVARREAARQAGAALSVIARELGIPSTDVEAALGADAEAAPLDWVESVGRVERESQKVADSMRERVGQTLESLRATLDSLREFGVDPAPNLGRLAELATQVPTAGPGELPKLLESARALTEEPVVEIVAGLLDEVRPRLVEARRLGRDPSEVFQAMNRAREALRLKIYSEALAASQEALDRVTDLTQDLDGARSEAASLQTLLDRLAAAGFPATPYREPLARALHQLERVDLAPARALLNETVRKLGSEAVDHFTKQLAELAGLVEVARERGFLPEGFEEGLAKARGLLADGEVAEAGELLSESEVRLRTAAGPYVARRVEEMEKGFEEFPEKSLVAPVRLLLADTDVHLRVKEDLAASLESLRRAEREFSAIFAAHASALVEGLEDERRTLEAMGGAGDELQRQIDEVQQIFNMGDFVKASKASQEIRNRAHQQMLLRSEEAVSHAKLALVEIGKMGLDAPKLRTGFEEAQASAKEHRYAEGYQRAVAVEHDATKLRHEAQRVLDGLDATSELWQTLQRAGVAVDGYRDGIAQAKQRYQALEFEGALAVLGQLDAQLRRERDGAEARRLLGEAELLFQDARRISVSIDPLLARSNALTSRAQGAAAAELLPEVQLLHRELIAALRPVLEEHLRSIERDLEVAQSSGVEVPKVVEMLGDARRRLAAPLPTGVAERLDAARAQLAETRGFFEHAERLTKRARDALSEAELAHAESGSFRGRIEELEGLLARREYARTIELAGGLEREIAQATYHHVSKTLAGFQGMVARLRMEGSDTTVAENLLRQARTALEDGHPLEALQLAGRSEGELELAELQVRIAQGSLSAVEHRLTEIAMEGVVTAAAQPLLVRARGSLEAKRYPEVLELSMEASDVLAQLKTAFRRSRDALDSAERQIQEADRFGAETMEAVTPLQEARADHARGAYPEATERAREASEKARWAIERVYGAGIAEIRRYLETGRKVGLLNELDAVIGPLDDAEAALKSRDWAHASERMERAREASFHALDAALAARVAALEPLYTEPEPVPAQELEARRAVAERVEAERGQHAYERAFATLEEEQRRAAERRRQDLARRLTDLKDRIWVGEKLGVDTTPVMELLSEARLALEGSNFASIPELAQRADRALGTILLPRVADRARDLQTEVVFAQEGLHVLLGPIPDRMAEVERLRSAGDAVAAGRLLLAQEEELNQRKSMHRELLNLHYLIDAALSKASERRLDASEARKLLDESIRARAADYAAALEKARAALALLQALVKDSEGSSPPPMLWPFKRPPTA